MRKNKLDQKEKLEKQNNKILNQTSIIFGNIKNFHANRHVKEENEPILDDIISSFNINYAKNVASKSSIEILKLIKSEV